MGTVPFLRLWTLAGVVVLVMPAAASSQTPSSKQPRVEITPYFGYAAGMTSMMDGWSQGFALSHAGTGATFGSRIAIRLNGDVSVETSAGYSDSGHMFGGPGYRGGHMGLYGSGLGSGGSSTGTLSYEGNVVYGFRSSKWVPYLTAGVGAFTSWPDRGSAWTDPVANFGVGLKFYPQQRIALRLDIRQYVGAFRRAREFPDGWSDTRRLAGHPQITAGMGFGF